MASNLAEFHLGELCEIKQGRYLGPGDMSDTKSENEPIPVIGANGVLGYTNKATYLEPVTLVTCRGSNCGMLQRTSGPAWISNNAMACVPKPPNDSRYIYYALKHVSFDDVITGSAQPQITTAHLNSKVVSISCDINYQKHVAAILGALDDKIELNRRMNETLEQMARVLFKSWFVDFDPVHAKAAGRQPAGMDKVTADLFPNSFEDSELGQIPKGWALGRLDDLARRVIDKVNTPADWASLPLIDLARMPQRSIALTDWGLGSELTTSVIRFKKHDVLFGAIRPYFHKVGVAPLDGATNISVFVIRPLREADGAFLAALASSDVTVECASRVAKGTKMPVVSWADFSSQRIIIPSQSARLEFNSVISPCIERIISNVHESSALMKIRDSLVKQIFNPKSSIV